MAQSYINKVAGVEQQVFPNITSAGAGDSGKLVGLDVTGRLDSTVMPVGYGEDAIDMPAFENLAAGDFVHLMNNAGVINAEKADAAGDKPADGFVLVTTVATDPVRVYFEGTNTQLATRTPAAQQFLSNVTPGATMETGLSQGSGFFTQTLGVALSATSMTTEIEPPTYLAGPP